MARNDTMEMTHGESNDHVTNDVTATSLLITPIRFGLNISKNWKCCYLLF